MGKKLVIVGPAYPYRGGIAAFSERLAAELQAEGHSVSLLTFTLQYPSFLFPGKTQYSDGPAPQGLRIKRMLSSIGPLSWGRSARWIMKQQPDMVIFCFWTPQMAPAFSAVARRCLGTERIGLLHNLLPHKKHFYDIPLARMFCRRMDSFITLSESVKKDLEALCSKPCTLARHPLYDNFGTPESREDACGAIGLNPAESHLLFFGLIREYKGLDLLLEAYSASTRRSRLVVAGEFYGGEQEYHAMAERLGIDKDIIWRSQYIPDAEVKHYFCAADLVVQPYKTATQSGITQIAYHFCKTMLVTRVGGLPETVPHGKVGYVADVNPDAIRAALEDWWDNKPDFSAGIAEEKKKYSWEELCNRLIHE